MKIRTGLSYRSNFPSLLFSSHCTCSLKYYKRTKLNQSTLDHKRFVLRYKFIFLRYINSYQKLGKLDLAEIKHRTICKFFARNIYIEEKNRTKRRKKRDNIHRAEWKSMKQGEKKGRGLVSSFHENENDGRHGWKARWKVRLSRQTMLPNRNGA